MKKILYTRPDGGVSIVIPSPKESIEQALCRYNDVQWENILPLLDAVDNDPNFSIHKVEDIIKMRPLTQEEYETHVRERSVPVDAINVRDIADSDIPASREFRNAWVDVTPESSIDIDCEKARNIKLEELRRVRNLELSKSDIEMTKALEEADSVKIKDLKTKRQSLRDITNPLKALDVAGKINDESLLTQIRELSILTV
jgi:hypothetical protein